MYANKIYGRDDWIYNKSFRRLSFLLIKFLQNCLISLSFQYQYISSNIYNTYMYIWSIKKDTLYKQFWWLQLKSFSAQNIYLVIIS